MLINVKDKKDDPQGLQQDLQSVYKDIKDKKNVDIVTPPQMSKDNDYALMVVIPKHGPNAESTNDLVHDLRDYHKDAQDKYGFKTEISGQSVINIDMSKKLNEAIPLFASVIVISILLINDSFPFNLNTFKSSIRICLIINGNIRVYNLCDARWLYERIIRHRNDRTNAGLLAGYYNWYTIRLSNGLRSLPYVANS